MSMNNRSNISPNIIRENIDSESEYSDELKLNIRCDDDDSHIAVLYCIKCERSLCKICSDSYHSRKAVSNHEIVRLTEKPEPPINCYLHKNEIAKLICKEPNCEGINKPICTMCHQYEKHRNHKYEMIEEEYTKVRKIITDCSKEIEKKQEVCQKNLDKFDKCISTYSTTETGDLKFERDKLVKFYSDASTFGLKTFDDFVNNRIETLNSSKNQYTSDKIKLDNLSSELGNIELMTKIEVIQSRENIKKMMTQAGKAIDEPTDLIPSSSYSISYPNIELMKIKINNNHIELSRNTELQAQLKTVAVYSTNSVYFGIVNQVIPMMNFENMKITQTGMNGVLCKYIDGRSILHLHLPPVNSNINLSLYKYVSVIYCFPYVLEKSKAKLKKRMANKWWSKIIVVIHEKDWENSEYVDKVRAVGKTDKRVEVIKYDIKNLLDLLFQS